MKEVTVKIYVNDSQIKTALPTGDSHQQPIAADLTTALDDLMRACNVLLADKTKAIKPIQVQALKRKVERIQSEVDKVVDCTNVRP